MWWLPTSSPMPSDTAWPSDVTSSPASAAWARLSAACSRIHPMIGMRAWPNTISEYWVYRTAPASSSSTISLSVLTTWS